MNIWEFYRKYAGQHIDQDHVFGYQCVDVVKKFAEEMGWQVPWGNAIALPSVALGGDYVFVKNMPWNFPDPGDIIVFSVGLFGHTGVVMSANPITVDVVQENYPLGSPVAIRRFNYISPRCVGWLKHKN